MAAVRNTSGSLRPGSSRTGERWQLCVCHADRWHSALQGRRREQAALPPGSVGQGKARSLAPPSARGGNAQAAPPPLRREPAHGPGAGRGGCCSSRAPISSPAGRSPRPRERAWPRTRLQVQLWGLRSHVASARWVTGTLRSMRGTRHPLSIMLRRASGCGCSPPPSAAVGLGNAHR